MDSIEDRREKRWAVITSDGGHGWLGRHTDPLKAEVDLMASQLEAQAAVGWLVVTEGVYYSNVPLSVMLVRPLTGSGDFESAKTLFLAKRDEVIKAS